jgi:uncharacterized protein (TIGR03437 family)
VLLKFSVSAPALLFLFAATATARSGGAPSQTSGAPGDGVCTRCHTTNPTPNSGPGSVKLSFAGGQTYTPGQTKRVTVTVDSPNGRRWGFEASPREAKDAQNHGAGVMASVNDTTQVSDVMDTKQWITHTSSGTRNGTTGPVSFEFDWTAPSSNVGDINFYVAANAANGNGNNQGDEIYTTMLPLTPAASGPPAISQNGVVNAASFRPGISAGSWITIGGTNLSSTAREWTGAEIVNGVLPTALDGTSVTVNGKPASIAYISSTQINALAPDDDATGNVNVVVKTSAGESPAIVATAQRFAPALFQFNSRYAAAVFPDKTPVGPAGMFGAGTRPVKAGDQILLFGTGFGPTNPATAANRVATAAAPLANTVQITVGGVPATVQFAGVSPPSPGLIQFNITMPAGVASGDQPVVATIGGVATPAGINLAVQ